MRWRTAVLAICLVATAACGIDGVEVISMPDGLVGTWETDDPAYAGRFFSLSTDEFSLLLIGAGATTPQRYRIVTITRQRAEFGMLHTVEYSDNAGVDYRMAFYFDPAGGGMLRLKNQRNMLWRKTRP